MRRNWQRCLLAAGLAIVACLAFNGWHRGPRYAGRPVGYWFPRFIREDPFDPSARWPRVEELAAGAPDAMPVLISAANQADGRFAAMYGRLKRVLPRVIGDRLPTWYPALEMRDDVDHVLKLACERADWLREFTNQFDQFPSRIQESSMRWMRGLRGREAIALPHLLRVLRGTNSALAMEAGQSLLVLPIWRADTVMEIVRGLEAIPETRWATSIVTTEITTELAAMGTNAAAAEPWMLRWLDSPIPQLRAQAAVTLPALAPERYPLKSTFLSQFPGLGLAEVDFALQESRIERTRHTLAWLDLLNEMAPCLDSSNAARLDLPKSAGPIPMRVLLPLSEILLLAFDKLGSNAAPALPYLITRLSDARSLVLEGLAARLVARIGPIAPETIPRLLPGLTHAPTAPPLVLLFAAYGPAAKPAVPFLEAIASGGELQATPSDSLPPGMQKRYGLFPPPSSPGYLVQASLAFDTGLTKYWPLPERLKGRTNLIWRPGQTGVDRPGAPGFLVPPATLSELAREALRHISGPEP